MSKFFGKGKTIANIFNLKEGVTAPSSLYDYNITTLKQEVANKLDPEPIIFISDPTYGNFIWANGELFGHSTKLTKENINYLIYHYDEISV